MPPTEIGATDLHRTAYETAWREFWYTHVMIEVGRDHRPTSIARNAPLAPVSPQD
jgi:hypothetical protein